MSHATARLLRERHSLDHGEAEHILGSFVDAVDKSLKEYGICHVTGIGTFVRAPGDRRLSFEPAESLSRAVNVRFADLPVYEVDRDGASRDTTLRPIPESEQPDISAPAPVQVQEQEQESAGSESAAEPDARVEADSAARPDPSLEADSAAASDAPLEADSATSADAVPRKAVSESETASRAEPEQESEQAGKFEQEPETARPDTEPESAAITEVAEPVVAGHAPDSGSPDSDEPDAVAPERPEKPKASGSRSPRSRKTERSGSSRAIWFTLPIVIALAAGAVWFLQRPEPETEPLASQTTPAAQSSESTGDQKPAETGGADAAGVLPNEGEAGIDTVRIAEGIEGPGDPVQAPAEALSQAEPSSSADSGPAYSLDRSVDGYTMIVGSSPDRAAADEQMSQFTELDLPFGVLDYSEEESSMYRLAVGLYDSAAEADSARQAMTDNLPSGTWVWRIR